jgi:Zn-dependent M28 family amino/carboxypeptidase
MPLGMLLSSFPPNRKKLRSFFIPGKLLILATMVGLLPSQGQAQYKQDLASKEVKRSLDQVNPLAIKAHMTYLSDDLLEGRQAGTRGFALAANYMSTQFQMLGLEPGVAGKSYLQDVMLRKGNVVENTSTLQIVRTGQTQTMRYGIDYFLQPHMMKTQSQVAAPVVFVGYGVSAPEMNYDDYAGIDVAGKIVLYLPGAPSRFPNNEKAYFSSELAKHSTAAAKGAVGVVTVVAGDDTRSGWTALLRRNQGGLNRWVNPEGQTNNYFPALAVTGSVYQEIAQKFFEGANITLAEAITALRAGKTVSRPLPLQVQMTVHTKHKEVKSYNVVGVLPGSDPVLKQEYVVYASHLDHLGITKPVNGDSINNGAHDNASGSAILLETARAFKNLSKAPKRSIIFLSCTAEEMGLLGSDYFATNPTVPASSLVANLALDMPFFFYPLNDIIPHGIQHSSLKGPVEATANFLGIKITPDPAPEEVVFTRSDHYSFIKKGIPALFIKGGIVSGKPNVAGAQVIADWRKNIYHKVDDEMDQPFDFTAGAMHAKTNFLIGYLVANDKQKPSWNKGDFFGTKFGRKGL